MIRKKPKIHKSGVFAKLAGYITQDGEDIAHYYSYIEEEARLPYYDGVSSLIHAEKRDHSSFLFIDQNIKPGIFPIEKERSSLSLLDGKRKILYSMTHSVYHFLAEDLGNIISFLFNNEEYSKLELIIDISGIYDVMISKKEYDMYWFFLQTLSDKGIPHRVVNFSDFNVIYIDNFFLLQHRQYMPLERFSDIHKYFLDYVDDKSAIPYRKVYVSRKKVGAGLLASEEITTSSGETKTIVPNRIDEEEPIERLFESLGFEIVYPEDFNNFRDQINFFYSVKTLASITSSGISNTMFMQPGGNLVEIITPLIARPVSSGGDPGFLNAEFHNYYKNIAASYDLLYIGIPNPNGKAIDTVNLIKDNKNIFKILHELE